MPQDSTSQDTERLQTEVERLRRDALEQMSNWQEEQQERRRLDAMVVRYKQQAKELAEDLEATRESLEKSQAEARALSHDKEQLEKQVAELSAELEKWRPEDADDDFR